ncbi:hypothetical protein SSX86_000945 [Deinandra increscens subsp. villosa]|uniref:Uncharacterized protein n=1 Tax=Deinandra increscens subsp. villosa TaxID=3103831 RepID=A0AAP0HE20_9ASTR
MAYNSTNNYLKLLDELVDIYNLPDRFTTILSGYVKFIYRSDLEDGYSTPMLWVGMYIALASVVCIIAMVADLLQGLRTRKLWFPCKYFRVNAAFLSVISVAMKLPMDLSGSMLGVVDQAAKLGSMAFMCTMMANLLPCLATMDNIELLSNITALCVLVITLAVNVCIQIHTVVVSYENDRVLLTFSHRYDVKSLVIGKHHLNIMLATIYVALLLVLLILHLSSSLAILKSKGIIEKKYQQGQERASKDIQHSKATTFEQLKNHVSNHWIMAGSGSPQFITACYQTTSASGVICVLIAILHAFTMWRTTNAMLDDKDYDSDYRSSTLVILIVQFFGVVIGTIAPLSRCFATLSFNVMSFKIISNHFKVFEVQSYWTRKLHDWKLATIRLPFRSHKLKVDVVRLSFRSHKLKVVTGTLKKLILIFCIEFQEGVVIVCNIIALIPFMFMICALYCYHFFKWLFKALFSSSSSNENLDHNKDLRAYVLQLEDEMELAERTLEDLSKSVNKLIQKGLKSQPENLMKLIEEKSTIGGDGFHGVVKFDNIDHNCVPCLLAKVHEYQDSRSWSLPVVTLTTIAVSLPKIEKNEVESLVKSVREGLVYVTLVEESLNVTDENLTVQKAAESLWQEVDVYHKWLGNKPLLEDPSSLVNSPTSDQVNTPSFEVKTAKQVVEWFKEKAKRVFSTRGQNDDLMNESICAISMYRITKTILLTHHANSEDRVSQTELFNSLSSMIADIIAACLTNLPQVITMKCHTSVIEKREESVRDAALLLGETKKIIETLQARGIPGMDPSDLPFIDKWRAYLRNP